jgi:hypothetical protein
MMRGLSGDFPLKTMAKSFAAAAILLALAGCQAPAARHAPAFAGPHVAGAMADPQNGEASGLAASRRARDLLWVHEDSDGASALYALDERGARRGRIRLEGVANIDWEDIATFTLDGRAWICVGDIGDNNARRPFIQLHFLPEPDPALLSPGTELVLRPAYTLRVAYADGARDCESLAVDGDERAVYLLSKREAVPRLYRLPLAPTPQIVTARPVGEMPGAPKPTAEQRLQAIPTGLYRASPCAIDFAPDGSAALVLTYGNVLYFPRARGETWSEALARPPVLLEGFDLPQAEAAGFSHDGRSIFLCSEDSPRLLRYDRR